MVFPVQSSHAATPYVLDTLTTINLFQYRMYLFEKILLCCKEINPNKPKNKIKGTAPVDKKGRPRLQLKGRIFMQNVTDTSSNSRPGKISLCWHHNGQ